MRIKMAHGNDTDVLKRLRARLRHRSLPTQEVIASAANVHQSTVSRAASGKLKRVTETVRRLDAYVSAFVEGRRKEPRGRRKISTGENRKARAGQSQPIQTDDVRLARQRCEEYLNQGYNPRVLVNQIEVLREAQSPR